MTYVFLLVWACSLNVKTDVYAEYKECKRVAIYLNNHYEECEAYCLKKEVK